MGALQEPLTQLWAGCVAETSSGCEFLVVRAPANLPRAGAYELFKGVIETHHWFGPLITNMR